MEVTVLVRPGASDAEIVRLVRDAMVLAPVSPDPTVPLPTPGGARATVPVRVRGSHLDFHDRQLVRRRRRRRSGA